MAKDPAFLFYYQDFLVGTSFMTLEEVGAYIKLLCFLADRGHLTEDQILKKLDPSIWEAIRCKFDKDEKGFFNKRLRNEVEKRKNFTESRRKNLHMKQHMDSHMVSHMENEDKNKDKDIKRKIKVSESEAIGIYTYYADNIRTGAKSDAVRSIKKLLSEGSITKEELKKRIDAYKETIVKKNGDPNFIIQANNFFGRAERYKEFVPKESKLKPAKKDCKLCKGTGWVYNESENKTKICYCRIKK